VWNSRTVAVLHHWNYFLALEDDLERLSRFVEFSTTNFSTYSTEISRLLMTAAQETDVLLQEVCKFYNDSSKNERGYQSFVPTKIPKLSQYEVELARWEISFRPFEAWSTGSTPEWWTANNKVKHERGVHFEKGSLENLLNATCALFLIALHFYETQSLLSEVWPSPRLLLCDALSASISPSPLGTITNFSVPIP
jgi:hypothetical protein